MKFVEGDTRMVKNFLCGIAVGIANIIPGVSGGTIMVILGLFDKVVESISNIFKVDNVNRKRDFFFLCQILIGALTGLVMFAKIIDYMFAKIPVQTMFWFIGLILFSVPALIKKEIPKEKISWIYFAIGMFIVSIIIFLNPEETNLIITSFPKLNPIFLIKLVLIGVIVGGTMIMPGISGSMVLLIMGDYYLFKSYVANVTKFELIILLPLFVIGIGVLLGIGLSAKITSYFLKNHKKNMISFILGLIIASCIALIPFNVEYTYVVMSGSIFAFVLGGIFITYVEKIV